MTDLTFDTPRMEVAARIGVAPDRIRTVEVQLDILRKQGLLIDLDISGTSMFAHQATWSEIGIPEDDIRASRLTRGQKFLIPEEQIKRLRSVETRMRQWLDRLSYDVTGFRPYRWLPYTAYDTWREKWNELTAELYQVKSDILANYDQYQDGLAADFLEVAEASWRSIRSQGYDWAIVDGKPFNSLDEFATVIVERAMAKFPSRERIELELHADYHTAMVYGKQDIAADEASAQVIRAEAEAKQREAYLQSAILQEQFNHNQRMIQMEEQERELKIEAMIQAEAEHARQQLQQIAAPFEEVFSALRQQISQDAVEMLESIQKNGFVRGKVAERGLGLIKVFDLLAVHDDRELRSHLEQLRVAIGPVGQGRTDSTPERSTAEVVAALENIRDLAHTAAEDLAAGPSRFSFID